MPHCFEKSKSMETINFQGNIMQNKIKNVIILRAINYLLIYLALQLNDH